MNLMLFLKSPILRICLTICVFLAADNCPVFGANLKVLPGHVPSAVSKLKPLGDLAATNELHLAIGLSLRDQAGLDQFLADVYNPSSPNYRHFLTPEEFADRFGPTRQDYAAVQEFARTNGFIITAQYPNRLLLDVRAKVTDVQQAFHVQLKRYKDPKAARTFFAPDANPMVDAGLRVADVRGLSDFSKPHPKVRKMDSTSVRPRNGSSPDGSSYIGTDFRNAYVPGTDLDGSGQSVGLVQFDGFHAGDITAYENLLPGAPRVPLQTVLLNGFDGSAGSNNIEVCLDIEMAIAMAPGLSKIIVFEGNDPNSVLNAMASSNTVKNLSCSWGWEGGPTTTTENIFKNMAAQGQSFFNASGDIDAYLSGEVDDPSSQNYPSGSANITQVGGTTLTMTGSGASYASEVVWNSGGGLGSSGGVSDVATIPSWQQGISMASNGGSTTYRNLPDVSLVADNIYVTFDNGSSTAVVGTSCSAPLWAGFMALVNQQAVEAGGQPVGFANPVLYALAKGPNYVAFFHDTVNGDNTWSGSPNSFFATPGFDLCTGWGTPAGTNLINALATPNSLVASPLAGLVSSGPVGGPFSMSEQTIALTNAGNTSISWSISDSVDWLTAFPASGTLAVGGRAEVTVSLNSAVDTLTTGVYTTGLTVSNLTSGISQSIPFTLKIGQQLLANGGFESGSFSDWTFDGTESTSGGTLIDGVVDASFGNGAGASFIHSGSYGVVLGDSSLAYLSQSIATIPGQGYLISFWLNNLSGTPPNQLRVNWNSPPSSTNTIFDVSNLGTISTWSNFQFVVTATSTNTTLQIAAINQSYYFGLDDVSVLAIPTPSFHSAERNNNLFSFNWNSLPGISYRVEYSTNLSNPNWIGLSTNSASTLMTSFTNAIGDNPQRFYRIRRLP